ncbi:hypothetical protein [Kitasatospora sp. NPDC058218]|uniref:hypothetical protein n=1 Tax=Kitasatospora sp. NPDC058218 TaxID=3346385 RepID=UPI0036D7950A
MDGGLTGRYLEAREASGASMDLQAAARRAPLLGYMAEDRCLSRPGFLGAAELARAVADLGVLFGLFAALPGRLHGADPAGFAGALGIEPPLADIIARTAGLVPPVSCRADLYHDGTGFRLLELNWSLAGAVAGELGRAMLREPAFGRFAADHGLVHVDPLEALARRLREAMGAGDGERPVVAVTAWPPLYARALPRLRLRADALGRAGFDARPCSLADLAARPDEMPVGHRVLQCLPDFKPGLQLAGCLDAQDERLLRARDGVGADQAVGPERVQELPNGRGLLPGPFLPAAAGERQADFVPVAERLRPAVDDGGRELRQDTAEHRAVVSPVGGLPGPPEEVRIEFDTRHLEECELFGTAPVARAVVLLWVRSRAVEDDSNGLQGRVEASPPCRVCESVIGVRLQGLRRPVPGEDRYATGRQARMTSEAESRPAGEPPMHPTSLPSSALGPLRTRQLVERPQTTAA